MNKTELTGACHKISKATGLSFNTVMLYYFLESILKRLAKGENKDKFIFKGGFLLSNVVGVESRSTVDIDFLLRNMQMLKETVSVTLRKELSRNLNDGISYELQKIIPIKEGDQYGGYRASILCKLENIKQVIPLDIATGDIVTPHPVDYSYLSIFGDEKIPIKAYTIETMIAEKLHTIYSRGFLNSRSKDYYDLYILYKLKNEDIGAEILKDACIRTFRYRKTEFDLVKLNDLLEKLKHDELFLKNWKAYSKKNIYVGDIKFEEAIENALKIIEKIKLP